MSTTVTFDGSNSALQHISALMRDPIGASASNLSTGPRQDIYGIMADNVVSKLPHLDGMITRDTLKQPTMTYMYGVTSRTMQSQLASKLPTLDNATLKLIADMTFEAMSEAVPSATAMRNWLQGIASDYGKRGEAMTWRTGDGMIITHWEVLQEQYRPRYTVGGNTRLGTMLIDTDKVDARGMRGGIVPNFVHSLDATHLRMVARAAASEGIQCGFVHDCFSTTPNNAGRLFDIVREQFAELYRMPLLDMLVQDLGSTTPPPPTGTFDIDEVLTSEFAFA